VLELGSGGGHNAVHLKAHFALTLVDLSEQMLEVSRVLNPECEHHQGDMRTLLVDRSVDAVFVHDAVDDMTSQEDLRRPSGRRTCTADPAASRCSFPTTPLRPSWRAAIPAARTVLTGAACDFSTGHGIPIRAMTWS